jgi:hypothetical protein
MTSASDMPDIVSGRLGEDVDFLAFSASVDAGLAP